MKIGNTIDFYQFLWSRCSFPPCFSTDGSLPDAKFKHLARVTLQKVGDFKEIGQWRNRVI